ncbi:hypothetical protein EC919_11512 [Pseudomonas graminis]|nr:hypothetical protein EC919_11512 [Pseudomonas graminis]
MAGAPSQSSGPGSVRKNTFPRGITLFSWHGVQLIQRDTQTEIKNPATFEPGFLFLNWRLRQIWQGFTW